MATIWEESADSGHRRVFRVELEVRSSTPPDAPPDLALHLAREFVGPTGEILASAQDGSFRVEGLVLKDDEVLAPLVNTITTNLRLIAAELARRAQTSQE